MKAKSIKGKSTAEIKSAFDASMSDGFQPTLAIVFISIKQDRKAVCDLLHQQNIDIIGATSCGEFINGYQDEGSAVILLLDISRNSYTILFEEIADGTVNDAATRLAQAAMSKFRKPGFILQSTGFSADGEYFDGENLIRCIENSIGPDMTVSGGMAGDDGTLTGTYIFTNDIETDRGIAALVLDQEKVTIHAMAISGWKPLGISKTITKSNANVVYTIDDQPAAEMYLRFLGKESIKAQDDLALMESIGFEYPFLLDRPVGEPVLRTPMSIDLDENALVCDLEMPQGATLRFSMPPDFDIVEKIIEAATRLKDTSEDADAVLIYSCAGRIQVLGPLVTAENDGLAHVWKAPMAGFFTYGEYGRTINGRPEFHSGTCSWIALKEK